MMRALILVPLIFLPLAACGPTSVPQAERECFERARLAAAPRGEVGFGVGSDGSSGGNLSLSVSSDFLMGRDPSQVYDSCVYQKSGQPPNRPLYSRPDWRG